MIQRRSFLAGLAAIACSPWKSIGSAKPISYSAVFACTRMIESEALLRSGVITINEWNRMLDKYEELKRNG